MNYPRPKSINDALLNATDWHVVRGNPLGVDGQDCSYELGCALGCQMPNELKSSYLEGRSVVEIFSSTNTTLKKIVDYFSLINDDINVVQAFLMDLQEAHDSVAVGCEAELSDGECYRFLNIEEAYGMVIEIWKSHITDEHLFDLIGMQDTI